MTQQLPLKRSPHLPDELWNAENRLIYRRRRESGVQEPQQTDQIENDHVVGLALSGGGIRSATISVGILQALAKHKCLSRIDYLSTVSGGGYAGAFLGGLFERWQRPADETRAAAFKRVEDALQDPKGHPIDWLRENGRYLAPNGAGSLALAAAIAIRNLVAIHMVIGTFFLMLSLMLNGMRRSLTRFAVPGDPSRPALLDRFFEDCNSLLTSHEVWVSPVIFAAAVLMIVAVLPSGIAYWLVRSDEQRDSEESSNWLRMMVHRRSARRSSST